MLHGCSHAIPCSQGYLHIPQAMSYNKDSVPSASRVYLNSMPWTITAYQLLPSLFEADYGVDPMLLTCEGIHTAAVA